MQVVEIPQQQVGPKPLAGKIHEGLQLDTLACNQLKLSLITLQQLTFKTQKNHNQTIALRVLQRWFGTTGQFSYQ